MAFRSTVTSSLFVLMRVLLFVAVSAQAIAEIERRVDYQHKWCNKNAIQINQGPTLPLPNGIPTYTVEIANTCVSGCNISHIHVDCGRFSSAILINPRIFKRLSYNDCLVNDGRPLRNGAILSFKYATTYPCPLSVSSVVCH